MSFDSPADVTGALAGEYIVTIIWPEENTSTAISMEAPPPPPDRLKGRYADPEKSKLTAVIKSGPNKLEPFNIE